MRQHIRPTSYLRALCVLQPTGARKTLLLTPDQGATLFALDFVGCTSVTFTVRDTQKALKLIV